MKTTRIVLAIAMTLAAALAADSALAWGRHGPRVAVSVGFGVPFAAFPYYYPYPPYYSPYSPPYYAAPVVVQQQPTVYVEQPAQTQPQQPTGYWYYCSDPRAYYPYVKDCPGGWQRVAPQPG